MTANPGNRVPTMSDSKLEDKLEEMSVSGNDFKMACDCGDDPQTACDYVARLIGLSTDLKKVLLQELNLSDEDPILVISVNAAWIGLHGQTAADAILDDIATFNMVAPRRRDVAGHRWLFHFSKSSDIDECRRQILANHSNAFSLSPDTIALGFRFSAVAVPECIPMAFCAIIHKLAVRENDVQKFNFFYF